MRKTNYISRMSDKDERLLYIAKNSYHLSREQALSIVSKNRMDNYIKQGIFKKIYYILNQKQGVAYELTRKGRLFTLEHYPEFGKNFYTSGTAIHHDIRLAQSIIEYEREHGHTWLNERDLREMMMERIEREPIERRFELMGKIERGEISVTDGGYYVGEELVLVETINENYTSTLIAAKEEFSNYMSSSINYVRQ